MEGKVFNGLTILKEIEPRIQNSGKKRRRVLCLCSCGKRHEAYLGHVVNSRIKSCGHLKYNFKEVEPGTKVKTFTYTGNMSMRKSSYILETVCECGITRKFRKAAFLKGDIKDCGCQTVKPYTIDIDLLNKTLDSKWVILAELPSYYTPSKHLVRMVQVKCECGIEKEIRLNTLTKDKSKGCTKCARNTWGPETAKFRKKLRGRYSRMLDRCYKPTDKHFFIYGMKGITVCDEWKNSFDAFYDWCVANGLYENPSLTIDRKDSKLSYSPDNCRLITLEENSLAVLNLTIEDVHFVRSKEFNWDLHRARFNCSDITLNNIIHRRTFSNV